MRTLPFALGLLLVLGRGNAGSDPAVKGGVDADLQKRIDEAVAKGRSFLEKICMAGDSRPTETPESLRQSAAANRAQAAASRKQAEEMKRKPDHAGTAKRLIQGMLDQAGALDRQAEDLLKRAEKLDRQPPPVQAAKPLREPAPASAFGLGMGLGGAMGLNLGQGELALIGLALVQSGLRPSDPLLEGIWEGIRKEDPSPTQSWETYCLSVRLMFVDGMMHAPEAWPPADRKAEVAGWVQRTAERLAGGCDGGAWGYSCAFEDKGRYTVTSRDDIGSAALAKAAVPRRGYDHSNTQYAVLGLKAAALSGARIPDGEILWRLVVQHFLNEQAPDGKAVKLLLEPENAEGGGIEGYGRSCQARARGWGYEAQPRDPPRARRDSATMTSAGLTALLVARSELALKPAEKAKVEEGVLDGLAWFQEGWAQVFPASGQDPGGYLLYGLERMGVLGNLRSIGGHAWYAEGARRLVSAQRADGGWSAPQSGADIAFDLLFLVRGTRTAYARSSYEVVDSP